MRDVAIPWRTEGFSGRSGIASSADCCFLAMTYSTLNTQHFHYSRIARVFFAAGRSQQRFSHASVFGQREISRKSAR